MFRAIEFFATSIYSDKLEHWKIFFCWHWSLGPHLHFYFMLGEFRTLLKTSEKDPKIFPATFKSPHLAWKYFKRVSKCDFIDIFHVNWKMSFKMWYDFSYGREKKQSYNLFNRSSQHLQWLHEKKFRKLTNLITSGFA